MKHPRNYPGVRRVGAAVELRIVVHTRTFEALEKLAFSHCRNPVGQLTYALLTMLGLQPKDDQVLESLLAKAGATDEPDTEEVCDGVA